MVRALLCLLLSIAAPASADIQGAGNMLNQLRAQAGLPRVAASPRLEQAARVHAVDMARNGFFSHTGRDGSRVAQRANRAGYNWCSIAENIAMGQRSVPEVMSDWMQSPSHRRNLLNSKVEEYGIARGPRDTWVIVLGRRGCQSAAVRGY